MKNSAAFADLNPLRPEAFRRLAWFRYRLRCFLRFSERVSRANGITPQQHQLLLGVAGYTGRSWATISELAEFLQGRHNAVVGLVQRAVDRGLVRKTPGERDRRFVRVHLTRRGIAILDKISHKNMNEFKALQFEILKTFPSTARDIPPAADG